MIEFSIHDLYQIKQFRTPSGPGSIWGNFSVVPEVSELLNFEYTTCMKSHIFVIYLAQV